MIGDVYLLKEKHVEIAKSIAEKSGTVNKLVITISGKSGSGKSEIAHELAKIFKMNGRFAKVLSVDDFYKIHPLERNEYRDKTGIIGLEEVDWDVINSVVEDFKAGKISKMPIIDSHSEQVDNLETDFKDISVLIFEGLYSANINADLNVMIETTWEIVMEAQMKRGKEKVNDERIKILKKESAVVDSLLDKCNFVVLAKDSSLVSLEDYKK